MSPISLISPIHDGFHDSYQGSNPEKFYRTRRMAGRGESGGVRALFPYSAHHSPRLRQGGIRNVQTIVPDSDDVHDGALSASSDERLLLHAARAEQTAAGGDEHHTLLPGDRPAGGARVRRASHVDHLHLQ